MEAFQYRKDKLRQPCGCSSFESQLKTYVYTRNNPQYLAEKKNRPGSDVLVLIMWFWGRSWNEYFKVLSDHDTSVCLPGLPMISHMLVREQALGSSKSGMDLHSGAAIWFELWVLGSLLCQMMLMLMALRTTGEYVSVMLTMALVQRKYRVYFSLLLTNFLLRAQWKVKEPWKLPRGIHSCSKSHASEHAWNSSLF